jgi:cysteinyl-tRNA synthetase
MYLYNTLTRKKEKFQALNPPQVGLYCCGPTVYDYQHIGNMRTYIFEDILKRTLKYNGYKVKHIMNITDIGHLVSDADEGEDKMMKALKREYKGEMIHESSQRKSMMKLAEKYTKAFKEDLLKLNIQEPDKYTKATKHVKEQIKLVQTLIDKGYTYETKDGIYFDTTKYPEYGKLALLDKQELQAGKRTSLGEKKDIHDFALWKFSQANENRIMEWKAFGRKGFPGWHAECSAMSQKYLGKHFDIHCGGIDHIPVHHTNERAQNNCATGIPECVNLWMHGEFLILDKAKMSKSAGTFITLQDAINKGINPLAYRYFCLMTHYRKPLSFSWEALESAQRGLNNLYNDIYSLGEKKGKINLEFKNKLLNSTNDDLNIPQILAVLQEVLKSNLKKEDKLTTILEFDKVLGLNLKSVKKEKINIPAEIKNLAEQRLNARQEKNWTESDKIRDEINKLGWEIEDNGDSYTLKKINTKN